jgi:hypothetical protein
MSTKEHTTIRRARVGRQPVVPAALLLAFVFSQQRPVDRRLASNRAME